MEVNHCLPFRLPGKEILGDTVHIIGYHAVGNVQDAGRRAVVFIQHDGLLGSEVHKEVRPGAAPLVDALVRVADDKEVPVFRRQALHQVPVVQIAVLGFIYHDVVEHVLPVFAGLREVVQDELGDVHQVVEIQRIVLHLTGYVAAQAG